MQGVINGTSFCIDSMIRTPNHWEISIYFWFDRNSDLKQAPVSPAFAQA